MRPTKNQLPRAAFSNWHLFTVGVLLTACCGTEGSKGFVKCRQANDAPHHPDCSACICDCPPNFPKKTIRYAYAKFREVRSSFRYQKQTGKCTWNVERSTAKESDNLTVTLYEWAKGMEKGYPIAKCCGVPFKLGGCNVTISVGSQLWNSVNINGVRLSPQLQLYQKLPDVTYRVYCSKYKKRVCIRLNIITGEIKLLSNSLSTSPAESSSGNSSPTVCTTTLSATFFKQGNVSYDLEQLVGGPVYQISANLDNHTIYVGEKRNVILYTCGILLNSIAFENGATDERNGLFCFFYLGQETVRTTLYCFHSKDPPEESISWTGIIVGVTVGSILVVAIVVLVVFCKRKPKQPKGEIVYHTWRKIDEKSSQIRRQGGPEAKEVKHGEPEAKDTLLDQF